jgi:apolipoprotein N-acyltransferase
LNVSNTPGATEGGRARPARAAHGGATGITANQWINFGLALLSAVLLVLLFPPFNLVWLAWVALAPLLVACARERSWKWRWFEGWAAGFLFWCGMCPWIQFVLEVHGGMGRWGSWGAFVLFGLYKGLHTAVFTAIAGVLMQRWWAVPAVAALWTGIERTHGYFGFAWLDLGNAGIAAPVLPRLAPVTGVYGLSFVFALAAAGVAVVILRRPKRELLWLAPLISIPLFPALPRPAPATALALLVQPNIDEEMHWTQASFADTKQRLAALSRADGANIVIWPEVPAPFYEDDRAFRDYAAQIARTSHAAFLFGAVAFTTDRQPLNSAVVIDSSGVIRDRYDKINLVPFGEFVPPLFGWVNRITHEAGDFVPGNRVVVFPINGHRASAFICYESAFPDLVRRFTRGGAEVLMNLSNDGYFGHSAAHEQHLAIVRMRAIENRRWILRATNDGISASIDPLGRVVSRLPPYVQTSALVPYGYERSETPYVRFGDWFAWSSLVLPLLLAVYEWRITRTSPSLTI